MVSVGRAARHKLTNKTCRKELDTNYGNHKSYVKKWLIGNRPVL